MLESCILHGTSTECGGKKESKVEWEVWEVWEKVMSGVAAVGIVQNTCVCVDKYQYIQFTNHYSVC